VKPRDTVAAFDRAARIYDRVGPRFFPLFGRRLVEVVDIRAGERVLDAACGAGAVLFPAADQVGSQGLVVGIDLAESMVDRLLREIAHRGLTRSRVLLMDAEDLAFPDTSFDSVLCGFALDLIPTPERALSEFRRVLVAGGRLGVSLSPGWWWEGDERWTWHAKLLRSLEAQARFGAAELDSVHKVEEAFRDRGFKDVVVLEERFDLAWTDPDEWWRWGWSHGWRQVLERMQRDQLERYRASCVQELRSMTVRLGGITGRLNVVLAVGAKVER
jgi:ubiquinone/menaquinone biosynthesis C-methylase UbiE